MLIVVECCFVFCCVWSLLVEFGIISYIELGIGFGEDDGEIGCFGLDMFDVYVELYCECV